MPKMISKVAHTYDGRNLAPGDPFDADPAFVNTLTVLGRAELVPMKAGQQYETRVMQAAAPSAASAQRTKRKYNTKRKAA